MKKPNHPKDHPEITDIKNICDVSPTEKSIKDICEKIKQAKTEKIKK